MSVTVVHESSPERDRIELAAKELDGLTVKVGWFEGNKYEDGTPVAYVAAIQEFGYPEGNIPPRLGMRSTTEAKVNEWRELVQKAVRGIPTGKRTANQVMEALGAAVAGDFRKTIAEVQSPPLKPATLAARKAKGNSSTKPLVDERILINTLTHQVEKQAS